MSQNVIKPPSWCPDAVPSDRGWRHPKTGELLVSVRGGIPVTPKIITEVMPEIEVLNETPVEEVKEVIVEEKPKKTTRKKTKNA